jgi:hypothetical protein
MRGRLGDQEELDWGKKGGAILRATQKKDFGAIKIFLEIFS